MIITSNEYNIRNNYNSMQVKNKCVVVDLNRFLAHITFAAIDRFRSMDQQSKAIANYTQNNFYNIQVNYQTANLAASSLMWVCFVVHTAQCSQQCREIASTVVHKSASADSLHCTLTAQQSAAAHLAKYSVSRVFF